MSSAVLHAMLAAGWTSAYRGVDGPVPGRIAFEPALSALLVVPAARSERDAPSVPAVAPSAAPAPTPVRASQSQGRARSGAITGGGPALAPVELPAAAGPTGAVEMFALTTTVPLGGEVETRLEHEFPDAVDQPIVMRPATEIGYPVEALRDGVEGTVRVWLIVEADGSIGERTLVEGPPPLADHVMQNLDRWVEQPALRNGKPVRYWIALEITFAR